ncbi:hypothetical protein DY000_02024203 [Brassica cretica]|uniref:Uncharacterized protein n=1 Tax=Brassica cretica TaxID=69181 RepID=A0ABQ7E0J1_BRACR|nr:hypothetical protein DY000_02024203 [Brassica cretica]
MVTPIRTKQETFRSRFEGEHKDGGRYVVSEGLTGRYVASGSRYVESEGLTGRYVASGSKPRRVLLVFIVKSQRKLRLRRNGKRFDENSNENAKEDLSEAMQTEESQARFVALPVGEKSWLGAVAAGVVLPTLLRTAILSFVFPDIVLIKWLRVRLICIPPPSSAKL